VDLARERADWTVMAARSRKADASGNGATNGLRPPPASDSAEGLVLGSFLLASILETDAVFPEDLADCFAIERNGRIYRFVLDRQARGEPIDHVTIYQSLNRHGETRRDDLSYLMGLPEGIPLPPNLNYYATVLRGLAERRKLVFALWELADRAALKSENPDNVVAAGAELFATVAARQTCATGQAYRSIDDIPTIAESQSH
jgi:replicative DNA helicase